MVINSVIDAMKVNGNRLCLDYLNTIRNRFRDPAESYLQNMNDLLYWGHKKAGILNDTQYALMCERPGMDAFYAYAMELRTRLDDIFYPLSQGGQPAAGALSAFNEILRFYRAHEEVAPGKEGFETSYTWDPGDFHQLIARIVASAHELLTSCQLDRLGACPRCGWVFLDTCKSGKRRWCSMEECGSAAKAKEYYHRTKTEK